ncbi:MAG: hypothetical protein M3Y74_19955 [Chloroflexota bacterium]|nr:hypothetical protein [Chloroflexota bacterium]
MTLLTDRYAAQSAGVVSCDDRLVVTGTLPGVCNAEGMATYLRRRSIRLFDYPRSAEPLRGDVKIIDLFRLCYASIARGACLYKNGYPA